MKKETKRPLSKKKQLKEDFLSALENAFGEVLTEYRFPWLVLKGISEMDVPEQKIYNALMSMRGFKDFYRIGTSLRCDYVLPRQKIIVEFDERQHFTLQRAKSFEFYPDDTTVFFDKKIWSERCYDLKAYDNDPPYRDEQRAFFDSLRDIRSFKNGFKLIRFYEKDLTSSEGIENSVQKIKEL